MKKKTPFLDLYKEWMERGRMPHIGLCNSFPRSLKKSEAVRLICPTEEDKDQLRKEGKCDIFWADGIRKGGSNYRAMVFTPLRQTIMLLCAALNGEM